MIIEKRRQLLGQTDDAIAYDACQTAYQLDASLIVAFTESGSTAERVSKYRPQTHILALRPEPGHLPAPDAAMGGYADDRPAVRDRGRAVRHR